MTPAELGAHLTARIPGATSSSSYDELTVDVPLAAWAQAAATVAGDPDVSCDFFDFLSAVDEGDAVSVVTHLYSPRTGHHVRLRTRVRAGETVPTLTGTFRGADWHERETHEMFGVAFTGEAHRVPLLLPDGFEGSPLRKDFVLASRVAKQWPGVVEPGEAPADRRPTLPPGVPQPGTWPAGAEGGAG
ncbi:MAG: dehydrogenase (ubiquinone) 30 kDa subunit [Frankiales bacterium]|nr:dehydrogenase (ubiquinone) 30 kDa subunit [Frankiales bacterium]